MVRAPNSLQSNRNTLQHDAQCYLAVRRHPLSKRPSGNNQEEVDVIVMKRLPLSISDAISKLFRNPVW